MVDVNVQLFDILKERIPSDCRQTTGPVQRYINTNASEKDWLKNVALITDPELVFSARQRVCAATFNGESFLICIGFNPDFTPGEFIYQEINAGLFCAVVVELGLEPSMDVVTGYELAESIFYPIEVNQPQRIGYDFLTLAKFFPSLYLYRIPLGSPFLVFGQIVSRVGLFSLTKSILLLPLSWSADALETIREICTTENKYFPIDLVLHAILERKWEHAFLDVYRCIEFLFPLPKVNDLRKALGLDAPAIDVSYQIESILGWRQQEDVALNTLFVKLSEDQLTLLSTALGIEAIDGDVAASKGKAVSKRIYKLRNDCVHYRPAQSMSQLKDLVNWPILVQELLKAAVTFHRNETSPQN